MILAIFGELPKHWVLYHAATMPKYKVGDHVLVKLSGGRIVEATIRAITESTDGTRLKVDFGFDETALVYDWQIVEGDPS